MSARVFIDGEAGTTGLQIRQRLAGRRDIEVLSIEPERRKDLQARRDLLNSADAVILCLPDDAAGEAVGLIESTHVKVIDASTAHRVDPDWAFGFPEFRDGQRDRIRSSGRISNPGCYSTGFIALLAPLIASDLMAPTFPVTANAISGYSGGGKGLIEEFEQQLPGSGTGDVIRTYGLSLTHKHVPEMQHWTGLAHPPLFAPTVGPLSLWALDKTVSPEDLRACLADRYAAEAFVQVASEAETAELVAQRSGAAGYYRDLDPESLNGTNLMRLYVLGNPARQQARLVAILDNLGKGASGAAVQNLNLALGMPETAGLVT
jgi:N-acetyl-gamma-glutamyl-phosphate reductase